MRDGPMKQQAAPDGGNRKHHRGRARWHVDDEWRDVLLGPQGLRLDEWLANGMARAVKHGANRTIYRVALPGREAFFLKHYAPRSWRDTARASARGSLTRHGCG